MWWMIVVILLIEWLVGLMSQYTIGGFIHVLLVIAIAVAVISIMQSRKSSSRRTVKNPFGRAALKTRQTVLNEMNAEDFTPDTKSWRFY